MKYIKQSHISIKRGETLELSSLGAVVTLQCSLGRVWITAAKDPKDYVVTAGHSLELKGKNQIVIEALSDQLELDVVLCA